MDKIIHLLDKDLSERWNIPISTLRSWRLRGKGCAFLKLGTAIRYRLKDVEEFEELNLYNLPDSTYYC